MPTLPRVFTLLAVLVVPFARADSIDDYARAQLEKHNVPAIALAVVRDGKPVKVQAYGLANVEHDVPATADTVFQLASVTKQFTAAAVMRLVEEGKLSLDDPVSKHVDDLPEPWRPVTVRQLLNHTSGIKGYTSAKEYRSRSNNDATAKEVLGLVADAPLEFKPGERHDYSNTGYYLLGLVIERASGAKYGEYVKAKIFEPLGMRSSRLNRLDDVIPHRADGYSFRDGAVKNARPPSMDWPYSAGALASTANDMAKWVAALQDGKVVSPASQSQMWSPTKLADGGKAPYGFGWQTGEHRGKRTVSHGGGIEGFSTMVLLFPEDRVGVVVLMNSDRTNPGRVAQDVAGLVDPSLARVVAAAIEDKDPEATALLRDVLARAADGTLDGKKFSPELWLAISAALKAQSDAVKSLGKLQKLEPLEREASGGTARRFKYRAAFEHRTMLIHFHLNDEGKIVLMNLEQE